MLAADGHPVSEHESVSLPTTKETAGVVIPESDLALVELLTCGNIAQI